MAHPDAPALSALLLVVIAAGLNVCCTSSATPTTPPKIAVSGSTASASQPATPIISTPGSAVTTAATSATVSLRTALGLTYTGSVNTAPEVGNLTTTPVSGTVTTHVTTSPWSSSGQQSTEHPLASGISAANPTTDIMIPSQTSAITSPQILSESSTIITTSNMTNNGTAGVTQSSSLQTSAVTMIPSEKLPTKAATSGETPTALVTSSGPEEKGTSSQGPLASKATPEASRTHGATFSAGVTVQEVEHALSSGSIAAITVTVIAVVLLVFGLAAFLKIRHSSYGRLFDDHDYGSWGNYNNPLYDDS